MMYNDSAQTILYFFLFFRSRFVDTIIFCQHFRNLFLIADSQIFVYVNANSKSESRIFPFVESKFGRQYLRTWSYRVYFYEQTNDVH